ncbi:MAG: hypothetical protein R2911_43375 [Caldilineaceae bacterium]
MPVVINNTDNLLVDAAAFYLNWQPELRVINVALGEQFEMVLAQDVNNDTGQINYTRGVR